MRKDILFCGFNTLFALDVKNFLLQNGYTPLTATLIDKLHLFIGWRNPIAVLIDLSIFNAFTVEQIKPIISSWQLLNTNFILFDDSDYSELFTNLPPNMYCMETPISYSELLNKLKQFQIPFTNPQINDFILS